MRSKLMKMNLDQLREICKRMNCDSGAKRKMIHDLLKPLNQKYKMKSKSFSKFKKRICRQSQKRPKILTKSIKK